jgi:MFS family permease
MTESDSSQPAMGPRSGNETGDPVEATGPLARAGPGMGRSGISPLASPRRLLLLASLWAALAALVSWGVGEAKLLEAPAKPERSTPATKEAAARVTSARLQAVFGGLLGFVLGSVGGMARRSMGAALTAGLVGAGVGAAVGAGASYFVLPVYARYRQMDGGDLAASLVLHASLWAGIGAAGGLALGLGLGGRLRPLQTALGGLLGAIAGGLLFDFLGAAAFPLEETGLPTSSTARTRLLARLLVAVLAAAAAAWAASQTPAKVGTTDRR